MGKIKELEILKEAGDTPTQQARRGTNPEEGKVSKENESATYNTNNQLNQGGEKNE
jgi:hypothetical protein